MINPPSNLPADGDTCDVCIIGSGAGGACVAYALQQAGVSKVVVLEKGIWRSDPRWPASHDNDEVYWERRRMSRPADPGEDHTLMSFDGGKKYEPHRIGIPYGTVGGLTVVYTCANWRFRREDFKKRSLYSEQLRRLTEGHAWPRVSLDDWPGRDFYTEIEHYYSKAEKLLGVSGDWDSDPHTQGGPGPGQLYRTDGSTYLPPLPFHRSNDVLAAAARKLGHHPFHIPMGISSTCHPNGLKPCVSCNFCSGYPCVWDAKNSVDLVLLRPICDKPNFRVVTDVTVRAILHDGASRVEAVEYSPRGSSEVRTLSARVVVLAAGAIASPRLLLLSEKRQVDNRGPFFDNPNIGRYLMFHVDAKRGVYLDHDKAIQAETMPYLAKKMAIMDEYLPKGKQLDLHVHHASIQSGSKGGPIAFAKKANRRDWSRYRSQYDLQAIVEDLPVNENRVELAGDALDEFGDDRARITHRYHPLDVSATVETAKQIDKIIDALEEKRAAMEPPLSSADGLQKFLKSLKPNGSHAMGTLRMGDGPANAATDSDGRPWRGSSGKVVQNLYVADASLFPTGAGLNPGLTVEAMGFRAADRILANHPELKP